MTATTTTTTTAITTTTITTTSRTMPGTARTLPTTTAAAGTPTAAATTRLTPPTTEESQRPHVARNVHCPPVRTRSDPTIADCSHQGRRQHGNSGPHSVNASANAPPSHPPSSTRQPASTRASQHHPHKGASTLHQNTAPIAATHLSRSWKEMDATGIVGATAHKKLNRSLNTGFVSPGIVLVVYSCPPIFTRAYGELRHARRRGGGAAAGTNDTQHGNNSEGATATTRVFSFFVTRTRELVHT